MDLLFGGGGDGLMSLLGGGIAGTAGNLLGRGIDELTGGFLSGSAQTQKLIKTAQENAYNMAIQKQGALNQAGMYNEAGQTGQAVGNTFQQKLASLGNTAQAKSAANAMNAYGREGVSNALLGGQQALKAQQSQYGGLRDVLKNSAGTPASARMGMIAKLGEGIGGSNAQALGESGKLMQGALGQAGSFQHGASELLNQDKAQQFATNVQPFAAKIHGAEAPIGAMAGMNTEGALATADNVENPLAGLAAGMGKQGMNAISNQGAQNYWNSMSPLWQKYYSNNPNAGNTEMPTENGSLPNLFPNGISLGGKS